MSKDQLEPKLAELMQTIPEIEGIIAFSPEGKIITGQTIEDMDKDNIAAKASKLLENLKNFGKGIGKGNIIEITANFEEGFAVVAFGEKYSILSFIDSTNKMQLGLLSRGLKNLLI